MTEIQRKAPSKLTMKHKFVDVFCILVGIKYDTISKIVGEDPMLEGLHTGPPGFMFVKFPSVFDTFHLPLRVCFYVFS